MIRTERRHLGYALSKVSGYFPFQLRAGHSLRLQAPIERFESGAPSVFEMFIVIESGGQFLQSRPPEGDALSSGSAVGH